MNAKALGKAIVAKFSILASEPIDGGNMGDADAQNTILQMQIIADATRKSLQAKSIEDENNRLDNFEW